MTTGEVVGTHFAASLDGELVAHLVGALDASVKVRAVLADDNAVLRLKLARVEQSLADAKEEVGVASGRANQASERARLAQSSADQFERRQVELLETVRMLNRQLDTANEDVVGLSLSEATYRDELEAAKAALARSQAEIARLRKRAATPPAAKPPRRK